MADMKDAAENRVQFENQVTSRPHIANAYYCQDFQWEDLRNEVEHEFLKEGLAISDNYCATESCTIEAWEKFHERHGKHAFFKERRYLVKEFPELLAAERPLKVLEVGCGTGSSVIPVLRANSKTIVYACDCSETALKRAHELVRIANPQHQHCRFIPFYCDVCTQNLPDWLHCTLCSKFKARLDDGEKNVVTSPTHIGLEEWKPTTSRTFYSLTENGFAEDGNDAGWSEKNVKRQSCCVGGMDIVMMVFTMSSIPPQKMQHVIKQCLSVLKPGGLLLFRDYGLYDMTMRRFPTSQRVGDKLYQRGDGTLSYFFTPEDLREFFTKEGFLEGEISLCCVELKNHKKLLPMKRVWIHAKFYKPVS